MNLSLEFLLSLAFIAYLTALLFVSRKQPQSSPSSATTPKPESSKLPSKPKYKYTLTLNDISKAQKIMDKLDNQGIKSTLTMNGGKIKLSFTTADKLQNASELKKKAVILDYEFETVKEQKEEEGFNLIFD